MVDIIKTDYNYRKSIWSRGRVKKVKDAVIDVEILKESQYGEKWVDSKQILEIQPYKSFSVDYEWRESLAVGVELDGLDTENLWYNSTVIAVRQDKDKDLLEVQVGFRVYRPEGDKLDA